MTAKRAPRPAKSAPPPEDAGADRRSAPPGEEAGTDLVTRRVITDPRTMRAVAHPVRLALLEALKREGELTATRAAELLDESPGNMSWHLQTLAKYGYVEEAGGGKGRSRPWRVTSEVNRFHTAGEDPQSASAGDALESIFAERSYSQLREWWARRASYPRDWRDAAFSSDSIGYLTAEEMSALGEEIAELMGRYRNRRRNKQLRPAGAQPVKLVAFGHPLTPTPSGN
jgi:DNA-binding transcriptional ArsR family regulator